MWLYEVKAISGEGTRDAQEIPSAERGAGEAGQVWRVKAIDPYWTSGSNRSRNNH